MIALVMGFGVAKLGGLRSHGQSGRFEHVETTRGETCAFFDKLPFSGVDV